MLLYAAEPAELIGIPAACEAAFRLHAAQREELRWEVPDGRRSRSNFHRAPPRGVALMAGVASLAVKIRAMVPDELLSTADISRRPGAERQWPVIRTYL